MRQTDGEFRYKAKQRSIFIRAVDKRQVKREHKCNWCELETDMIHAHHVDYDKPFEVIYLCMWCHSKIHTQLNKFACIRAKDTAEFIDSLIAEIVV